MDQARIATTDEIVEATDLLTWDMELVHRPELHVPIDSVQCEACRVCVASKTEGRALLLC